MSELHGSPGNQPPTDFDGAWKEAIEYDFPAFLAFFLPEAYADVDWVRGFAFLDQELHQLAQDGEIGRRSVDKLVKVWRRDGVETWVLVHVEVQSQHDAGFAERMYVYNYRVFDRYRRRVASIAVLGDESPGWRPDRYGYDLWNCSVAIRFPVVKLSDFRDRWALLETSTNPFAIVVMAHLKTQETHGSLDNRKRWKWAFTRRLYDMGLGRDDVIRLYRFIDWLMWLPPVLQAAYWQEVKMYEQEQSTTFISYAESIGMELGFQRGREEGLAEGKAEGKAQGKAEGIEQGKREGFLAAIELGLDLNFGNTGMALLPSIAEITDPERLQSIYSALKRREDLAVIARLCRD